MGIRYGDLYGESSMGIFGEDPLWASSVWDRPWGCPMGIVCWNLLRGSSMGILYGDLLEDPL